MKAVVHGRSEVIARGRMKKRGETSEIAITGEMTGVIVLDQETGLINGAREAVRGSERGIEIEMVGVRGVDRGIEKGGSIRVEIEGRIEIRGIGDEAQVGRGIDHGEVCISHVIQSINLIAKIDR